MTPNQFKDLKRYNKILCHVPAMPVSTYQKALYPSRTAMAEALNVTKSTIENWIERDWIIVDNKLYAPHREIVPPDEQVTGIMTLWPMIEPPVEFEGQDAAPPKRGRGRPKGAPNEQQNMAKIARRLATLEKKEKERSEAE